MQAADAAAAEAAAAAAKEHGESAPTNGQNKSQNGVKNGSAAHLTSKTRAADYYIAAGDLQYRSGAAK